MQNKTPCREIPSLFSVIRIVEKNLGTPHVLPFQGRHEVGRQPFRPIT